MKVLITGGSGLVGQNILESHLLDRYEILSPGRKELNYFDAKMVQDYLKAKQPDLIVHCAGRVGGIQDNLTHPVDFLVENLDINRNLIEGAYQARVKKLLNLGTSCMYPRAVANPLKEETILTGELEPTNEGYAIAKVMAQRLCSYINKENKQFLYKTLIPCNLYGRHDKFDPQRSHLIPAIIHKLHLAKKENQKEVEIWGDGTARREFMYCGDLVSCIARAIDPEKEFFDSLPEVMNVGIGRDYSVNEYYEIAAKVVGYQGKFGHDLSKPVGMKQKLVSTDKLNRWGWQSQTTLLEGLKKTYAFYLEKYQTGVE